MKETKQPVFTDGQTVIWNRVGEDERVTIDHWWRCKWPNGSSGYERIGYDIKEYPGTWAWEHELSPVERKS